MKNFILKFLLPFFFSGAFFSWLIVYRQGWDAATYGGADPWGLVFEAMGGAFAPTAVALLVAGAVKLFKRDASFLNTWLTVFLIAFAVFAVSNFTVARSERGDALSMRSGAMRNCPISADFTPQARTVEIDETEEFQGRAWRTIDVYADGFSSLDCYLVTPSEMLGDMTHIDVLLAWAAQEGLEQEGIFAVDTPFPHSRMLSRKVVEGREVAFEHRIFLFREAFVLTATAGDPATFPSERNRAFTASITVVAGQD